MDDGLSILILGGSQGAEIFGTVVPTAIKMVKEKGFLIEWSFSERILFSMYLRQIFRDKRKRFFLKGSSFFAPFHVFFTIISWKITGFPETWMHF